jgi:hypothetical protein
MNGQVDIAYGVDFLRNPSKRVHLGRDLGRGRDVQVGTCMNRKNTRCLGKSAECRPSGQCCCLGCYPYGGYSRNICREWGETVIPTSRTCICHSLRQSMTRCARCCAAQAKAGFIWFSTCQFSDSSSESSLPVTGSDDTHFSSLLGPPRISHTFQSHNRLHFSQIFSLFF